MLKAFRYSWHCSVPQFLYSTPAPGHEQSRSDWLLGCPSLSFYVGVQIISKSSWDDFCMGTLLNARPKMAVWPSLGSEDSHSQLKCVLEVLKGTRGNSEPPCQSAGVAKQSSKNKTNKPKNKIKKKTKNPPPPTGKDEALMRLSVIGFLWSLQLWPICGEGLKAIGFGGKHRFWISFHGL